MPKEFNHWESLINVDDVREIRLASKVFFGCGAIAKIDEICEDLVKEGIKRVIVISGKNAYKTTGAWDYCEKAFKKHNIAYINYDKISPNPVATDVDEATKIALDFKAEAVVAIGGGSPIDAGKSVAIMMKYPEKTTNELYEMEFAPTEAAKIVAINLTHGTGTECNRFAVVTIAEKNYKPAICYDCIYPSYSIDDPSLCLSLSDHQTRYTAIDAVNHVIEAATTIVASPITIEFARRVIELVATYLPEAIKDPSNKRARYWLMYASMLAGTAFDNGLLHFTHALEHPLSAVKPNLAHGLGLSMILPAVVETIYASRPEVLKYILAPISSDLRPEGADAARAAKAMENWLFDMGVTSKLTDEGFSESDIKDLVELVYETPGLTGLIEIAPVDGSERAIERIYKKSLHKMP